MKHPVASTHAPAIAWGAGILGTLAAATVVVTVVTMSLADRPPVERPVLTGATAAAGPSARPVAALLRTFAAPPPALGLVGAAADPSGATASLGSTSAAPVDLAPSGSPSSSDSPDGSTLLAGTWNLTWNDEFTGTALSSSSWTALNDSTFGDGNRQLECELASNATVSGGALSLMAQHEHPAVTCGSRDSRFPNGRAYSGATIQTKDKADFTYGYFEIRAKLPMAPGASKGLWPAFWLRPTDGGAGEIDVLETVGTPAGGEDAVHQTIHAAYGSGIPQQEHTAYYPSGSLSSGYHTYGLDWEPGSIDWYIDGKLTYSRTTATTSWMQQDFSRPYFLRLNFAVGGDWPGSPDASTRFPASYDIDWIRVYQH